MKIGEIGSFAIWCKKGALPQCSPPPVPKPRTVSLGLKQLSLADSEQQAPGKPVAQSGSRHASFTLHNSADDGSSIYNLSAMDGVPFTLHPKFERSTDVQVLSDRNPQPAGYSRAPPEFPEPSSGLYVRPAAPWGC